MIVRDKSRILPLLFAWHGTILPKTLPAIAALSLLSVLLGLVAHFQWFHLPKPPLLGFTVFGIILSIFIGFRNNACYERWWEGRKLWGALIAAQRHLIRDSQILPPERRSRLLHQIILFTRLLRDRLRQIPADGTGLPAAGLPENVIVRTGSHPNAPQYILEHSQAELLAALRQGEIGEIVYSALSAHLETLGNVQAGCDRIASTPLPFAYSVLLHRAIFGFCMMLPFSLDQALGIWTPLMVAWLVYLFLGLDLLSNQLEEPFGRQENDLPLDTLVLLVEREILTALDGNAPPAPAARNYVLN